MRKYSFLLIVLLAAVGCEQSISTDKQWVYEKTISLEGVNPIGIAVNESGIWLSDGDHNRLVRISDNGDILETIDGLDRPMHIASAEGKLYIPQYGNDVIAVYADSKSDVLAVKDSLDAPAGIYVLGDQLAIADFYHQKIHFFDGTDWKNFGKEGKDNGEFYYPTDVQITEDKIWVADAYNHRIQVFDKEAKHLLTFGQNEKMNATTGIYVGPNQVYATDFENDRVLIFDHQGNTIQRIESRIHKPTDLMIHENKLWVINYRKGEIVILN